MRIILLLTLLLELISAQKMALVIGNSDYTKGYLSNPINDAKLIAKTLGSVGFRVITKTNLQNRTEMERVINSFASKVSSSDIVAIYYSGHGVQYRGRDYLMPTKANVVKKGQLPSVSVDVDFLLGGVSDAKLAIVMLDACRNNPYRSFVKGIPKGLGQAPISGDGGMIISYATEANRVANDGDGANSPYALALKKYIKSSDPIETVFRKVRGEVSRLTHKEQKPMTKMLFEGDFAFMGRYVPTPTPRPTTKPTSQWITPTDKKVSWKKAKQICRENGARLPTIEELRKVVSDCGGINVTYDNKDWRSVTDKNRANKSYQACYKRKGFISYNYWSSTTNVSDSSYAWSVSFNDGYDYWPSKTYEGGVRCVRGGQ